MADMIELVIRVTEKERDQLKARAAARGFENVDDYLKTLIELDADESTLYDIRDGIKQGLREALRGEYLPLDSLWSDDDESIVRECVLNSN